MAAAQIPASCSAELLSRSTNFSRPMRWRKSATMRASSAVAARSGKLSAQRPSILQNKETCVADSDMAARKKARHMPGFFCIRFRRPAFFLSNAVGWSSILRLGSNDFLFCVLKEDNHPYSLASVTKELRKKRGEANAGGAGGVVSDTVPPGGGSTAGTPSARSSGSLRR